MNRIRATLLSALLLASSAAMADSNPSDPYEPYNRFMFRINDAADRYVMTPVARGYRAVTPKPVRTGVSNFYNNLRDVVSFGSNVLRLDIKRASEDFMRVSVNSTFGLGGLIDIAGAGGIPDNKNTLGDTFASWGWKNSNYFVFPLTGPSTVRDSVGSALVSVYPVDNFFLSRPIERIGAKALNAVNTREGLLDLTDSLEGAALDKYSYTRDFYMKMRTHQLGLPAPADSSTDDINIDDLVPGSSHQEALPSENPSGMISVENSVSSDSNAPPSSAEPTQENQPDDTEHLPSGS